MIEHKSLPAGDSDPELTQHGVMTALLERGRVDLICDTREEVDLLVERIKEAEVRLERQIHLKVLGYDEDPPKNICFTAWLCQPVDWESRPFLDA